MKGKIVGFLAAGMLAGPIAASATTSFAPVDFLGTLDVTCVGYSVADCGTGGVVAISGSLSSSGIFDFGTATNPNFFVGTLSSSNTVTGVGTSLDGSVTDVTFTRTSVPATNTIVGDWSGVGTQVVIGTGDNDATRIADLVIASTTFSAPEIDPASAASGLTLLVGVLVVLRGRRPQRLTA
jgi:hypothetical protein